MLDFWIFPPTSLWELSESKLMVSCVNLEIVSFALAVKCWEQISQDPLFDVAHSLVHMPFLVQLLPIGPRSTTLCSSALEKVPVGEDSINNSKKDFFQSDMDHLNLFRHHDLCSAPLNNRGSRRGLCSKSDCVFCVVVLTAMFHSSVHESTGGTVST